MARELKRKYRHTVRFTEDEYNQIHADMASIDCLSTAKYIRLKVLGTKRTPSISAEPDIKVSRGVRNQINQLTKQISRLGSNYNQIVTKYNTSCNAVKKNGDPVISTKATYWYMQRLAEITEQVKDKQEQIINLISNL